MNGASFFFPAKGSKFNSCHDNLGQFCSTGGSAYSQAAVDEALEFVQKAILSSARMNNYESLSSEAQSLLSETVDKDKNYTLYRGIGVIRRRVDPSNIEALKNLSVGDEVPGFLTRQTSNVSSYTKKENVAKTYSEGAMKIIVQSENPRIVADLENLKKVMDKHKLTSDILSPEDFSYFKKDKEVFVLEPSKAIVKSISGRL